MPLVDSIHRQTEDREIGVRMEPKEIDKVFSQFIRDKMESNHLNQSELSRLTGGR